MEHKVLNHLGFIDTYQMAHNNCHPLGSIAPYGTRWYWCVHTLFLFMLSMLALAHYTAQPFSKHSVDVNQKMCGIFIGQLHKICYYMCGHWCTLELNYNGIYNEEMCACVPLTTGLEL